jgi:valyl-tRNA synthetase
VAAEVNRLMEEYQFGEAQRLIHDFLWGEFCDWYIEMAKLRLRQGDPRPLPVLAHVLEATLRLLHPFMPFITEELWQGLRGRLSGEAMPDSIMVAPYPVAGHAFNVSVEGEMERVMDIVRAIRNFRAESKLDPSRWVEAVVEAGEARDAVTAHAAAIEALARARPLAILGEPAPRPEGAAVLVLRDVQVVLSRAGLADLSRERERLEKEMAQARANIERLQAKLADAPFLAKAPPQVVEKERQRLAESCDRLARLQERLAALGH